MKVFGTYEGQGAVPDRRNAETFSQIAHFSETLDAGSQAVNQIIRRPSK